MKPRKPLKRTPLAPGKPIERHTQMPRGGFKSKAGNLNQKQRGSGPVKARRVQRPGESAEERHARELVWARAAKPDGYPLCEVCGQRPPTEYQHRKAKAHCAPAEKWAVSNGLAVCGHGNVSGCHGERIHQQPTEAYLNGWSVRSGHDPIRRWVLRRGVRVWLDDQGGFTPAEEAA